MTWQQQWQQQYPYPMSGSGGGMGYSTGGGGMGYSTGGGGMGYRTGGGGMGYSTGGGGGRSFYRAGNKRKFGGGQQDGGTGSTDPPAAKTPFMVMNEKFPIINQLIKWQEGVDPSGKKFYRCYAEMQGVLYSGEGSNKKIAKHVMAERALEKLVPAAERQNLYKPIPDTVTSDEGVFWGEKGQENATEMFPGRRGVLQRLQELCGAKKDPSWTPKFEFMETSEPDCKAQEKRFGCKLKIADKEISMEGKGKKSLKLEAAAKALKEIFEIPESEVEELMANVKMTTRRGGRSTKDLDPMTLGAAMIEKLTPDKSPVTIFFELCSKMNKKATCEMDTADGKPPEAGSKFKAVLLYDDQRYEGAGWSKRDAKIMACCAGLKEIFKVDLDSSSYLTANQKDGTGKQQSSRINRDALTKAPCEIKPPAQLLNELWTLQHGTKQGEEALAAQKLEYIFVEENPQDKLQRYVMKVKCGDKEFTGAGFSKKLAKTQAARDALRQIFELETPDPALMMPIKKFSHFPGGDPADGLFGYGGATFASESTKFSAPTLGDLVATLVRKKYLELCTEHGLTPSSYLAGFVLTTGATMRDGFVVSMGTGALPVESRPTNNGLTLLDSHAEVLARRGLLLFFYQQLGMLTDPLMASMSVFEPIGPQMSGYRLKENVKIHLFCSLPPPGDARIRAPKETDPGEREEGGTPAQQQTTDYRDHSVLRAANRAGCVATSNLLPNDGTVHVMCASDKILKWNALGVQGALLSNFVQPMYLDTVVVGANFNHDQAARALYQRLIPKLTEPVPEPKIVGTSGLDKITEKPQPPDSSVLWTTAAPGVELLAPVTGRDLTGKPSRVCKQFLFEQFAKLWGRLNPISNPKANWKKYSQAKNTALNYQKSKFEFQQMCKKEGLGQWMVKSAEIEDFELPWCD